MPEPIVEPTSTAVALHNPRRRTRMGAPAAALGSTGVAGRGDAVGGEMEALMSGCFSGRCYGSHGSCHAPPPLATTACGGGTSFTKMASLAAESLFWAATLACLVAQLAILRAVVLGPPGDEPLEAEGAADPRRAPPPRRRGRAAEATWALLPGIALAFVLLWTWHAVRPAKSPPPQTNSSSPIAPAARA